MLRALVILMLTSCASLGIADFHRIRHRMGRFALHVADLKVDLIETSSGKWSICNLWVNRTTREVSEYRVAMVVSQPIGEAKEPNV